MLAETCTAFGCTPEEAKRLDYGDVRGILDYRAALLAYERFQAKDAEALLGNPALMAILLRMHRAQSGLELAGDPADDAALTAALLRAATPDEEEPE